MANSGSHRAESIASQRENPFANLKRRRDQEGSVHDYAQEQKPFSSWKSHLSRTTQ